jgi:hypothetical protein
MEGVLHKMKKNRLTSLVLALALTASLGTTSFAAVTAPGTGTTAVNITTTATNFSVTVPTAIAAAVAADGTVTVGSPTIVNNSAGAVKVTKVTLNNGVWSLRSYNNGSRVDMSAAAVDSKLIGLQLTASNASVASASSDTSQELTTDTTAWKMTGAPDASDNSNQLPITVNAIATASSSSIAVAEKAVDVVFTIAWDKTT